MLSIYAFEHLSNKIGLKSNQLEEPVYSCQYQTVFATNGLLSDIFV